MNRLMKRCVLAALVAVSAGFAASCGSSAPTAPTTTGAGAPTFSLSGRVVDAAIVPVPGAQVTIVAGGETVSSALTDGGGRYELRGLPGGAITVRASKEGYVADTFNLELPRASPLDLVLRFTGPSFNLEGTYTVTFTADAACTQLPAEIRTRTYSASAVPTVLNHYYFRLSGGHFYYNGSHDGFEASVAGRFASFFTLPDGSEAVVHERLTDSRSIWIDFFAGAVPVDVPSASVSMFATYAYCGDNDFSNGAMGCRVPRITCTSSNHTFTLTRR